MKTNRRNLRAANICRHLQQLVVALCVLAPSDTSAQGLSGAIIGTVRDVQGGVVSGAMVHVSSAALIGGRATTATSEKGHWRFPVLPPGMYTIQITSSAFAPHREEDIELGVRKQGHDTIGWSDVAGQYRAETRTLADGRSVAVSALDTSITPASARRFLLTNQDDYSAAYNGLVMAVEKRRVDGWQAFGSYTWSRAYGLQPSSGTTAAGEQTNTIGPGGIFGRDPNDLTNAGGRLPNDRPHVLRAMAAVDVPRTGLLVAANLQYFSGKPWAATTVVALPQNTAQRILLEPRGTRRLSAQTLLDLRVSRAFRAGGLGRLELLIDVLNALNEKAEEGIVTDALTTATIPRVPTFGMPNVFVDPRRAMVGMRIDFGRP